jgi:hypothetical protein
MALGMSKSSSLKKAIKCRRNTLCLTSQLHPVAAAASFTSLKGAIMQLKVFFISSFVSLARPMIHPHQSSSTNRIIIFFYFQKPELQFFHQKSDSEPQLRKNMSK